MEWFTRPVVLVDHAGHLAALHRRVKRRQDIRGLLLCAVQFLDVADSSIMNVALPSIRRDLGFTVQNLQWVLSGYLLTYGGLLLLGGRAADLLGRRRRLTAGTALFAASSLAGGLAADAGMLIGARLAQGAGAAMMAPAGLSILTTTFSQGTSPRNKHPAPSRHAPPAPGERRPPVLPCGCGIRQRHAARFPPPRFCPSRARCTGHPGSRSAWPTQLSASSSSACSP
jgi:Major Facilitator Superfamily